MPNVNSEIYNRAEVPRHLGLSIDGNGRWARRRGLSRSKGHRAGVGNILPVVEAAAEAGVETVTVYGFSTENWNRPESEVQSALYLVLKAIEDQTPRFDKNGFRLSFIGGRAELPIKLSTAMQQAERITESNAGMRCYLCVNYGGQAEIVEAARRIAEDGLPPGELNSARFREYLLAPEAPPVDLLVRTGGEQRISNFPLWQIAYAELYFTETLWPDFSVRDLSRAFDAYRLRTRRYGAFPTAEDISKKVG